ncbi:peptidyl-prolyl cis-trans isomerase-like 3 [Apiospora rasikravindrae]|uniref:Peptidyl-prolyl cis-trans isomerase n=1 Tax=Apiospora rasikravindrae TaxID=990691 RepID=A0ABR1SYB5_9PEZI
MSVTLHTNFGDLKIEVFCESVPKTAENFLSLYGGPGNPTPENPKAGQSIWGAGFEDEIRPTLKHNARGIVSMANKGPATNGSQFFVLFDKAAHLDGLNTVFGKLIGDDSLVTLSKLEALEIDKKSRPKEKAFIEKVTIHANPLA